MLSGVLALAVTKIARQRTVLMPNEPTPFIGHHSSHRTSSMAGALSRVFLLSECIIKYRVFSENVRKEKKGKPLPQLPSVEISNEPCLPKNATLCLNTYIT